MSGVPPIAAGGNDCGGQPGGVPGRIHTWTSGETGPDRSRCARALSPGRGNWSKEHKETLEVAVLTRGSAPHSSLRRSQGPMPLVCSSLRDKSVMEKGTPVSCHLGSSGRVGEPRLGVPLNGETPIIYVLSNIKVKDTSLGMQMELQEIITNHNQLIIYDNPGGDINSHILTYTLLQHPYEVGLLFLLLS